jgi:hypothetical protein
MFILIFMELKIKIFLDINLIKRPNLIIMEKLKWTKLKISTWLLYLIMQMISFNFKVYNYINSYKI